MTQNSSQPSDSNPLADLDEWEEFLRERYPAAAREVVVPRLRQQRLARRSVSSTVLITVSDGRLCQREEAPVSEQRPACDGDLGGDGIPQHAGR